MSLRYLTKHSRGSIVSFTLLPRAAQCRRHSSLSHSTKGWITEKITPSRGRSLHQRSPLRRTASRANNASFTYEFQEEKLTASNDEQRRSRTVLTKHEGKFQAPINSASGRDLNSLSEAPLHEPDSAVINQECSEMATLENSIEDLEKDVLTFRLSPVQHRLLRRRIDSKKTIHEHKTNWSSLLRSKGSWSYDWRITLLELVNSHQSQIRQNNCNVEHYYYLVGKPRDYSQTPAEQIPKPTSWSKSRFASHVDALAMAKVPRVVQRYVYKTNEPDAFNSADAHILRVRDALLALFEDESMHPYFSPSAFDIALVFFYRSSMVRSSRKLFEIMVDQKIPIMANTFNIMLWGAAKQSDLHNFTYLLRLMVRQGISPNEDTWIAFLAGVESEVAKIFIMKTMNGLGLLQVKKTLQMAVTQLVGAEIKAHIHTKDKLESLFERLDTKYGRGWFSVSAGNRICDGLGDAGLISQIPDLLTMMHSNGTHPNNTTLAIILRHCMRAQNMDLALHILKFFDKQYGIIPTQVEFGYLFMIGWSTKSYNICRVIWRIACVEAAVPYRMEELVFKSLIRNTPKTPINRNQKWMKDAGKVIIGVDFNLGHKINQESSEQEVMQTLTEWSATGSSRTQALERASHVITLDLASSLKSHNPHDFVDVCEQALKLDRTWKAENKTSEKIWWKLTKAFRIEFPPKIRKIWTKEQAVKRTTAFNDLDSNKKVRKHFRKLSVRHVMTKR